MPLTRKWATDDPDELARQLAAFEIRLASALDGSILTPTNRLTSDYRARYWDVALAFATISIVIPSPAAPNAGPIVVKCDTTNAITVTLRAGGSWTIDQGSTKTVSGAMAVARLLPVPRYNNWVVL